MNDSSGPDDEDATSDSSRPDDEEATTGGTSEQPISADRLGELETQVEELRREIGPPRGPLGLPRPPTPGELLRFTDEHAIPTTIAILEATVRALKALEQAIKLLRRVEDRDIRERTDGLRNRTDTVAREAIEEFDRAVADLAEAVEGGGLPDEEQARSVLQEARAVREEVTSALDAEQESSTETKGSGGRPATDDGNGEREASDSGVEVDVEAELDSIREEVRDANAGTEEPGESEHGADGHREGEGDEDAGT